MKIHHCSFFFGVFAGEGVTGASIKYARSGAKTNTPRNLEIEFDN
jgi:hypothetical protein